MSKLKDVSSKLDAAIENYYNPEDSDNEPWKTPRELREKRLHQLFNGVSYLGSNGMKKDLLRATFTGISDRVSNVLDSSGYSEKLIKFLGNTRGELGSLLLYGKAGVGKSCTLSAIFRAILVARHLEKRVFEDRRDFLEKELENSEWNLKRCKWYENYKTWETNYQQWKRQREVDKDKNYRDSLELFPYPDGVQYYINPNAPYGHRKINPLSVPIDEQRSAYCNAWWLQDQEERKRWEGEEKILKEEKFVWGSEYSEKKKQISGWVEFPTNLAWVYFDRCSDFVRKEACTEYKGKEMVVRAKEALMSIDILFIDDLGSEMKEDLLIQGFWNSLIKQRLEDEKTTFITTNQSLEQLKETFDDRFVSRLNSMTQIGFGDDMTDRRVG
jgi:hypothetical protein